MQQEPKSQEIPSEDCPLNTLQALEQNDRPAICANMRLILYQAHLMFSLCEEDQGLDLVTQAREQMEACVKGQMTETNLFETFRQIGKLLRQNGQEADACACEQLAQTFAGMERDYWPCFSPTIPDALHSVAPTDNSVDAKLIDLYHWVTSNGRPSTPPNGIRAVTKSSRPPHTLKQLDANRISGLFRI